MARQYRPGSLPKNMRFAIVVAIAAFAIGFFLSYAAFKQIQTIEKPVFVCPNQTATAGNQTVQQTMPTPDILYDLRVDLSTTNPSLGRGETLVFTGKVTDLKYIPVGAADVNATLLNYGGDAINKGSFSAYPNGTFIGRLSIPTSLTELGTYNLTAQAHLGNRWSSPAYTQFYVVR